MSKGSAHRTIHSLVPAYAASDRIHRLAMDGIRDGRADHYIYIRDFANEGMGILAGLENDLKKELLK